MDERLFVKTGPEAALDMFQGEADGLAEIASTDTIRVPKVEDVGLRDGRAFIALERLAFDRVDTDAERLLGERLAAMHRCTADQFGWHRDNTIGMTPQINTRSENWVEFFREHRLRYQLDLAARGGFTGEVQELGAELAHKLDDLFADYTPAPSLLHGDLWGGNWGVSGGEPVIFDPAVYYGDRESDIAMTKLFGGFGRAFYEAYEAAWPFEYGSHQRELLYKLYHVLNHVNLFGAAYVGRSLDLLRQLTRNE